MPFWRRDASSTSPQAGQQSGFEQWIPAGALKHPKWMGLVTLLCAAGVLYMGFSSDKPAQQAPPSAAVSSRDQPVQPQSVLALQKSTDDEYAQLQALKDEMKRLHDNATGEHPGEPSPQTLADLQRQQANALQDAAMERRRFDQQYANNRQPSAAQVAPTQDQRSTSIVFDDRKPQASGTESPDTLKRDQESERPQAQPAANTEKQVIGAEARKDLDFDPTLPTFNLPEGTVIESVLTNRLEGSTPNGPVNAMVTTPVYAPGTRTCLLPQGAIFLGDSAAVSGFGQDRLAVTFHRIRCGTGKHLYTIPLDAHKMPGLDQAGAGGLKDKTNNHYLSTFGAAVAIGAVTGLANIGNFSGNANGYNAQGQFQTGISQSVAESSARVLEKFLNRLPTITIREGTRVKIILIDDVKAPAYPVPASL